MPAEGRPPAGLRRDLARRLSAGLAVLLASAGVVLGLGVLGELAGAQRTNTGPTAGPVAIEEEGTHP